MSLNLLFSRGYGKGKGRKQAIDCCCSNTDSTLLLLEQQFAANWFGLSVMKNGGLSCFQK